MTVTTTIAKNGISSAKNLHNAALAISGIGITAVSYTHLDVYKRQRFPLDLPFSGKGRIVDLDTALEIKRGIKAVSYTHLDVYKRQPWPIEHSQHLFQPAILPECSPAD